jgi:hypothetical protein
MAAKKQRENSLQIDGAIAGRRRLETECAFSSPFSALSPFLSVRQPLGARALRAGKSGGREKREEQRERDSARLAPPPLSLCFSREMSSKREE